MIEQQFGYVEIGGIEHHVMMCVDDDENNEATIYFWTKNEPAQGAHVIISVLENGDLDLKCKTYFRTDKNYNFFIPDIIDLEKQYENYTIRLKSMGSGFDGWWHGPTGGGAIKLSPVERVAKVEPTICNSWNDFKNWAVEIRALNDTACYRGHSDNRFDLRTAFHRTKRQRLEKFQARDLSIFHDHAQTHLNRPIDMSNPAELSSILALAQHHGLPTPLLDITRSPYIAAFFAFSDLVDNADRRNKSEYVRIYAFTRQFIEGHSPPSVRVHFPVPYICRLRVSGLNNPRLSAQQGEFIITNIVDVEYAILQIEQASGTKILFAADIPSSCAIEALEDLSFMGLTAATLFPGLDGICRMLRHESHFKRPLLETADEAKSTPPEPILKGGLGRKLSTPGAGEG